MQETREPDPESIEGSDGSNGEGSGEHSLTVDQEQEAEEIFLDLMSEVHANVEEELSGSGFMEEEEEDEVQSFEDAFKYLKTLGQRWRAAATGKSHDQVRSYELEKLHEMVQDLERSARLELKAVCYMSMLRERLSEVEVSESDVEEFRDARDDGHRSVGDYLTEATQQAEMSETPREKRMKIASRVNGMVSEELEDLEDQMRREKQIIDKYEKFMVLLEGLEKELEAIKESRDREDNIDQIQAVVSRSSAHVKVTLHERKELVEKVTRAEDVKENVSRVLYRSLFR